MASTLYVAQSLPTSDTFTDLLSGGEVTIESGQGVYVLDDGEYYRYDPSDPDADTNGYVALGSEVILAAEKGQPGGVASLDADGFAEQRPLTSVATHSDLRALSGKSGVAAELRGDGGGIFVWESTDPNGRGDDSGLVLSASGGGWWVRQIPDDRPRVQFALDTARMFSYILEGKDRNYSIEHDETSDPDFGIIAVDHVYMRNMTLTANSTFGQAIMGHPGRRDFFHWEDVNFDAQDRCPAAVWMMGDYCPYITIDRCTFRNGTQYALAIQTFVATIENCRFQGRQ